MNFFWEGEKVKIWQFIGWFCVKDKLLRQKTDTAVYCPHTEGLWKVSAKSESWQGGLSLIYLYSSIGKVRGVRCVIMPAFCCYENICKLKTQEPQPKFKWNLPDILIYVPPQHLSFLKKWGRQWLGDRGGTSKNWPKNAQKIYKMSTLTSPRSNLKNAIKLGFFSTVILNHLTLVLIWGKGEGL